jgi:hypothetical protein
MKTMLKNAAVCVTISLLFVLAVLGCRLTLGSDASGIVLLTAAVMPPSAAEIAWSNGPVFPPDPVDIPALKTELSNGPVFPPDPVDIPALAGLNNGPVFPPDPVDIPSARG